MARGGRGVREAGSGAGTAQRLAEGDVPRAKASSGTGSGEAQAGGKQRCRPGGQAGSQRGGGGE